MLSNKSRYVFVIMLLYSLSLSTIALAETPQDSRVISERFVHTNSDGSVIYTPNGIQSFSFAATNISEYLYYISADIEIREKEDIHANIMASALNPTIYLGSVENYQLGKVYAVYYKINYGIIGETTTYSTEWQVARVGKHDFYFTIAITDEETPIIGVNGTNPMFMEVNAPFIDPGATAWNSLEGDISQRLTVTGEVYTSQIGTYYLYYNVTDSMGFAAEEKVRTVHVVDSMDLVKLERVTIDPSTVTLSIGETHSTVVQAVYSDGSSVNANSQATYWIDNPSIAAVDDLGKIKASSTGTTTLTASYEGFVTHATIRVLADDDSSLPDEQQNNLIVTSNGGTFTIHEVTFIIPQNAITREIKITVEKLEDIAEQWIKDGSRIISHIVEITKNRKENFVEKEEDKPIVEEPKPSINLTDIHGHWAEGNIKRLVELGIIEGYPDRTFKPNNHITRAEFAAMVVKAFNIKSQTGEIQTGKVFKDTADHWGREAIATAYAHGIVSGYNETTFGPNDYITQEQMAMMIVKVAVTKAVEDNVITGYPDNTFKPKASATRAEAVTVVLRVLKD